MNKKMGVVRPNTGYFSPFPSQSMRKIVSEFEENREILRRSSSRGIDIILTENTQQIEAYFSYITENITEKYSEEHGQENEDLEASNYLKYNLDTLKSYLFSYVNVKNVLSKEKIKGFLDIVSLILTIVSICQSTAGSLITVENNIENITNVENVIIEKKVYNINIIESEEKDN